MSVLKTVPEEKINDNGDIKSSQIKFTHADG